MSNAMDATRSLLFALSAGVGQAIDLDSQGECCLEFQDAIEIAIAIPPDFEFLTVRAPIAAAAEVALETLRTAMAINYGHLPAGHSTALDAASGQLVLMALLNPEKVSQEEFLETLTGFLQLVPELRSRLAASVRVPDGLPTDFAFRRG